jgi:hypothetical protein
VRNVRLVVEMKKKKEEDWEMEVIRKIVEIPATTQSKVLVAWILGREYERLKGLG